MRYDTVVTLIDYGEMNRMPDKNYAREKLNEWQELARVTPLAEEDTKRLYGTVIKGVSTVLLQNEPVRPFNVFVINNVEYNIRSVTRNKRRVQYVIERVM